MFAPQGIVPWDAIKEHSQSPWSIHGWLTHNWQLHTLFGTQFILALSFCGGFATRWCAIISWILLVSLYNRNPIGAYGADNYLRFCMLWAMFLPLDSYWALGLKPKSAFSPRIVSIATTGYILHLVIIYMSAGISKNGPGWMNGTAIATVLSWNDMATPFGSWLGTFGAVTKILTYGTLLTEVCAPICLFIPTRFGWFRLVAILAFMGLHAGIGATMHLSIFPWIGITVWLALIPSGIWDRWAECEVRKEVGRSELSSLSTTLCGVFLSLIVAGNVANFTPHLRWPNWFYQLRLATGLVEHWYFFAPDPPSASYWVVAHGRDTEQNVIDLLRHHEPPDLEPGIKPNYSSIHWQGLFIRLLNQPEQRMVAHALSQYLCMRHANLTQVTLFLVTRRIQAPDSKGKPEPRRLHSQYCDPSE